MSEEEKLITSFRARLEDLRRNWYQMRQNSLSLVGMAIILSVVAIAVLAPYITPHPEDVGMSVHFEVKLMPPSPEHWFGTDNLGRDIFTRTMYGSRYALYMGVIVLTLAIGIGLPLGLIAGIWGGRVETLIMRVTDIFLAVPSIAMALAFASIWTPSLINGIIAISLVWWPWYTRFVRGEVLHLKEEQFVEASRALGASRMRIAFKDILPNLVTVISVKASLDLGYAILNGATLSFLGMGAQDPIPDWGTIMSYGRQFLPRAWWTVTFPGIFIFMTVLGFNLLGDGLRDAFDVSVR